MRCTRRAERFCPVSSLLLLDVVQGYAFVEAPRYGTKSLPLPPMGIFEMGSKNAEGRFKKVGDFMEGVAGFDKAECPVTIDFGRLFTRFR